MNMRSKVPAVGNDETLVQSMTELLIKIGALESRRDREIRVNYDFVKKLLIAIAITSSIANMASKNTNSSGKGWLNYLPASVGQFAEGIANKMTQLTPSFIARLLPKISNSAAVAALMIHLTEYQHHAQRKDDIVKFEDYIRNQDVLMEKLEDQLATLKIQLDKLDAELKAAGIDNVLINDQMQVLVHENVTLENNNRDLHNTNSSLEARLKAKATQAVNPHNNRNRPNLSSAQATGLSMSAAAAAPASASDAISVSAATADSISAASASSSAVIVAPASVATLSGTSASGISHADVRVNVTPAVTVQNQSLFARNVAPHCVGESAPRIYHYLPSQASAIGEDILEAYIVAHCDYHQQISKPFTHDDKVKLIQHWFKLASREYYFQVEGVSDHGAYESSTVIFSAEDAATQYVLGRQICLNHLTHASQQYIIQASATSVTSTLSMYKGL